MANGFGFMKPAQQGTPDPMQVGAALMQRQQPASSMGMMDEASQQTDDAQMRRQGAELMGGPGQTELGLSLEQGPSAINTAVGEALTRMGGGHQPNPNQSKPRGEAMRMLMHLGLSEQEAELMIATGGA